MIIHMAIASCPRTNACTHDIITYLVLPFSATAFSELLALLSSSSSSSSSASFVATAAAADVWVVAAASEAELTCDLLNSSMFVALDASGPAMAAILGLDDLGGGDTSDDTLLLLKTPGITECPCSP
jgi:hypothetical protein